MFGKYAHKPGTDFVEPDLPITPMLDMSFQLLAFFIMTFQPKPAEGQILLALPKEEGGASAVPSVTDATTTVTYVVAVAAAGGAIGSMALYEKGNEVTKTDLKASPEEFFAQLEKLSGDLKKKNEGRDEKDRIKAKLVLELDPTLQHAFVVQLLDAGVRAGFLDIAPVLPSK